MTEMEKRIKNEEVQIPEGLSPENMMKKLSSMTEEEKLARATGEDIPVVEREEKKPVSFQSYRRFIYPAASAAALFIVLGLGILIGRSGAFFRGGMNKTASAEMASDSAAYDGAVMEEASEDALAGGADSAMAEDAAEPAPAVGAEKDAAASDSMTAGAETIEAEEGACTYDELYAYFDQKLQQQREYVEWENDEDYKMTGDLAMDDVEESIIYEAAEDSEAVAVSPDSAREFTSASRDYSETNVRTEGVMEGDIVKTDGEYIYVYEDSNGHIRIYKAEEGKLSKAAGKIKVYPDIVGECEFYIEGDRLVVLGQGEGSVFDRESKTTILLYDISDKDKPVRVGILSQDGEYYSSRLADGCLYTFSRRWIPLNEIDKKKPVTYIPRVMDDLIPEGRIFLQKKCNVDRYVVMTALPLSGDEFSDKKAILAGGDLLYVGPTRIVLADRSYDWIGFRSDQDTELYSFTYEDGRIRKAAEGEIPGYLNDDYSIDEKKGHLRILTTYSDMEGQANALYILDEKLRGISVIRNIAEGETIRSARFMGNMAYFVTFRNTDPLFAVDLTDEEDPEIVGYLKIPGFSAYLHPFGEGLLLGIGYDTDYTDNYGRREWYDPIKLTMFDISDPTDIKELYTETIDAATEASVLTNRNAFYCDTKRQLFGFSVMADDHSSGMKGYYLLMHYDPDYGFENKLEKNLGESNHAMQDARGVSIDDYFYLMVPGQEHSSYSLKDYKLVEETN